MFVGAVAPNCAVWRTSTTVHAKLETSDFLNKMVHSEKSGGDDGVSGARNLSGSASAYYQ
jgi:hypothetical protein